MTNVIRHDSPRVALVAAGLLVGTAGLGAFAAVAAPAGAIAAAPPTAPTAVVGKWTRVVTNAERQRQSGLGSPAGRWTMRIERNTALTFFAPGGGLFSGNVTVSGKRIHFTVGAGGPNSYAWSRVGTS